MTKSRTRSPARPNAAETRRSSGGPARRVGEMLPDIGHSAFRKFGFVQSAVVTRWPEIVGERYARVSAPESIRFPRGERTDGVLHMVCASAHAPMMQHVTPEIMERINRFFGYTAVARVVIRHGEVKIAKASRPPESKPVPISEELGESLRTIADPELKTVLEALAKGIAASEAPPIPIIGKIS